MNYRLLIVILMLPLSGFAKLPLKEIEALRRKTIVVRVVLDNPQSPLVKKCKLKKLNIANIGAKLQLAQDNAAKTWASQNIVMEDLQDLDEKVQACAKRASCSAYEAFVAAAKPDASIQQEVTVVKEALDKNAAQLTAQDYVAAWKAIPGACTLLTQFAK